MITIIGAGPAGSYLASLLAREEDVTVFEEHDKIGFPVQCSGITTQALAEILEIKKHFLINKIKNAKIIAPNDKHIEIRLTKPNLILDRAELDKYLAERAEDEGVKFHLNHKYENCEITNRGITLKFNGEVKTFKTDVLIGADGPFSKVAKTTGLWKERKFAIGAQARINLEVDPETVEFYINQGCFGWVIPESNKTARVGVATYAQPNERFKSLLKRRQIDYKKIIGYQSGMIPVYDPNAKTQNGNVYLLGDAATHVKATTFGGIVQGLMAAEELNKAITYKKDYEKLWKKRIGGDLRIGLLIRRKLDNFTDNEYNKLVGLFSQERIKRVLETKDRDYPSKFILELLLKEPRLLRFAFI